MLTDPPENTTENTPADGPTEEEVLKLLDNTNEDAAYDREVATFWAAPGREHEDRVSVQAIADMATEVDKLFDKFAAFATPMEMTGACVYLAELKSQGVRAKRDLFVDEGRMSAEQADAVLGRYERGIAIGKALARRQLNARELESRAPGGAGRVQVMSLKDLLAGMT